MTNRDLTRPATGLAHDTPVIAFHCSGGTGRQWRRLVAALAPRIVTAPDLFGTNVRGHWTGGPGFELEDEAQPILDALLPFSGKVHLVGHSYGGALALHIARRMPDRVASLSLFEPTAFQFLASRAERESICPLHRIAERLSAGFTAPADRGLDLLLAACAEQFVTFWSGSEAWASMPESARADVIGYIAKARAELAALLAEPAGEDAYRALTCPVLLLRGDRRNPAATATSRLADAIPGARLCTIRRAGHMGPMTHADSVNAAIVEHVRAADEPQAKDTSRRRSTDGISH